MARRAFIIEYLAGRERYSARAVNLEQARAVAARDGVAQAIAVHIVRQDRREGHRFRDILGHRYGRTRGGRRVILVGDADGHRPGRGRPAALRRRDVDAVGGFRLIIGARLELEIAGCRIKGEGPRVDAAQRIGYRAEVHIGVGGDCLVDQGRWIGILRHARRAARGEDRRVVVEVGDVDRCGCSGRRTLRVSYRNGQYVTDRALIIQHLAGRERDGAGGVDLEQAARVAAGDGVAQRVTQRRIEIGCADRREDFSVGDIFVEGDRLARRCGGVVENVRRSYRSAAVEAEQFDRGGGDQFPGPAERVGAAGLADRVGRPATRQIGGVAARSADQRVLAAAAMERIVAAAAGQGIVALAAIERVLAAIADQAVVATQAGDHIVRTRAVERIVGAIPGQILRRAGDGQGESAGGGSVAVVGDDIVDRDRRALAGGQAIIDRLGRAGQARRRGEDQLAADDREIIGNVGLFAQRQVAKTAYRIDIDGEALERLAFILVDIGVVGDQIEGAPDIFRQRRQVRDGHRRIILAVDGEGQRSADRAVIARFRLEFYAVSDAFAVVEPVEGGAVVADRTGFLVKGDETNERSRGRCRALCGNAAAVRDIFGGRGRIAGVGVGDRHIACDVKADRRAGVSFGQIHHAAHGDGCRVVPAGDVDGERAGRLVARAPAIVGDGVVEGLADQFTAVERLRVRIRIVQHIAVAAVRFDEQVAIFARDLRFAGHAVKNEINLRVGARRAFDKLERRILGAVGVEPVCAVHAGQVAADAGMGQDIAALDDRAGRGRWDVDFRRIIGAGDGDDERLLAGCSRLVLQRHRVGQRQRVAGAQEVEIGRGGVGPADRLLLPARADGVVEAQPVQQRFRNARIADDSVGRIPQFNLRRARRYGQRVADIGILDGEEPVGFNCLSRGIAGFRLIVRQRDYREQRRVIGARHGDGDKLREECVLLVLHLDSVGEGEGVVLLEIVEVDVRGREIPGDAPGAAAIGLRHGQPQQVLQRRFV